MNNKRIFLIEVDCDICNKECNELCDRKPCEKRCQKVLKCKIIINAMGYVVKDAHLV